MPVQLIARPANMPGLFDVLYASIYADQEPTEVFATDVTIGQLRHLASRPGIEIRRET